MFWSKWVIHVNSSMKRIMPAAVVSHSVLVLRLSRYDILHISVVWTIDISAFILNILLIAVIVLKLETVVILCVRVCNPELRSTFERIRYSFCSMRLSIWSLQQPVRWEPSGNPRINYVEKQTNFQGDFGPPRLHDFRLPRSLFISQWSCVSLVPG